MNQLIDTIWHRMFPIHPTFEGWGMTTVTTHPPWNSPVGADDVTSYFVDANTKLKEAITKKEIVLAQFPNDTALGSLDALMWRNYFVYTFTKIAFENTKSSKNIVECGVCDGMGVYFALSAAREFGRKCDCYLYDSWGVMKKEYLLETEYKEIGNYSYLNIDNTKRNLNGFGSLHFNQGYIPDVFKTSDNPESIILLMIDLNSGVPTMESLKFFFDKLEDGGVIIFDDYSWILYEDTKKLADEFLKDKPGTMLALPTGQSVFIKRAGIK